MTKFFRLLAVFFLGIGIYFVEGVILTQVFNLAMIDTGTVLVAESLFLLFCALCAKYWTGIKASKRFIFIIGLIASILLVVILCDQPIKLWLNQNGLPTNISVFTVLFVVIYVAIWLIALFVRLLKFVFGKIKTNYKAWLKATFTTNGILTFVLAFIILMIAGITESVVYTWQEWILVLVIIFAIALVVVKVLSGAKFKSLIRAVILLIVLVIGGGLAVSTIAYLYVWFAQGVVNQYVQYVKPAVFKPYLIAGATIVLLIVCSYCWSKGKQKGLAALAIATGTAILMQSYTIAHAQSVLGVKLVLIPAGLIVPFGIGAFALAGFFLLWDKVK